MPLRLATVAAAAVIVLTLVAVNPGSAAAADEGDVLTGLRPTHPRIWLTADDVPRLRESVRTDGLAKDYFRRVERSGAKMLDDAPAERVLVGPRLLSVSRATLRRVRTWAGLYLITGERRYADRAIREMRTVAAFTDWNPSHFLDTAEMTAALAIGYDWLYDAMTEDDRAIVRGAIVKHGLTPGIDGYREKRGWTRLTNNWAQVCSGGMTMGALAIGDEEADLARDIVTHARDALKVPMTFFGPDGGFSEGPGYWNYATQYTVYYLAALETALGTDFGYANSPGLAETGLFRIHTIGPSGLTFNYADARDQVGQAPQMLWMARRYDRPAYAAHERKIAGDDPDFLHLLWLDPRGDDRTLSALPTPSFFRGVDVATFRSGWDNDALFVAIKGGDNKASHAHLDLGTFVLDVGKRRWVCDPGPDDYNLPGYFGKQRWTYYHLATEGQNTIQIDGANQALDAKAKIVEFDPAGAAVIDLSAAYAPRARVTRSLRMSGGIVTVEDEVVATAEPVDAAWAVHTPADVKIDDAGRSVVLTRDGERLFVTALSPADAKFEAKPVAPPAPQRTREGMTKLILRPPAKVSEARIVVRFSREKGGR